MPIPAWPEPLNEGDQAIYDDLVLLGLEHEELEEGLRAVIEYINNNFTRRTNG